MMVQPSCRPLGGRESCILKMGEAKDGLSLMSIHTSGRWTVDGGVLERRKLPGAIWSSMEVGVQCSSNWTA